MTSRSQRGCAVAAAFAVVLGSIAMCLVCAIPYTGARLENATPLPLGEVTEDWTVRDSAMDPWVVAGDIYRDCRPMGNGINVIYQQLWYNTMTSGYDDVIWLEGPEGSYDAFGLYRWSDNLFLRDETRANGYNHQVLVCDTSLWVW